MFDHGTYHEYSAYELGTPQSSRKPGENENCRNIQSYDSAFHASTMLFEYRMGVPKENSLGMCIRREEGLEVRASLIKAPCWN